jgi:hypothetical protein
VTIAHRLDTIIYASKVLAMAGGELKVCVTECVFRSLRYVCAYVCVCLCAKKLLACVFCERAWGGNELWEG